MVPIEEQVWRTETVSIDAFLAELWTQLRQAEALEPSEAPEGIGELAGARGTVAYAVRREADFAALRWHEGARAHEAFYLRPTDGAVRLGWRRVGPPAGSDDEVARVALARWPGVQPVSLTTGAPSFTELVAVLASAGGVTLDDTALRSAHEACEAQLQYYRALAGEHADAARQVRAQLRALALAPARASSAETPPASVDEPPEDLSGLAAWAQANASRITVLSRALKAAKRSRYLQPMHVYQALEFLAGPYREHRCGRLGLREFEAALAASGLRLAGSVGESVAGMQGTEYFVHHEGRRCFLDLHLTRGGGRDERYCLRVYFFWNEPAQKAVVGWLPSHLSNSLS
jgi:hypothetical protein